MCWMMVGWDGSVCNYVDTIPRTVIYGQSEHVVFFSIFEKKSRYCCGPRTHRLPSPRIYVRKAYCIRTVLAQPRIYWLPFPRFNSLHSDLTRSPDLQNSISSKFYLSHLELSIPLPP